MGELVGKRSKPSRQIPPRS